MRAIAIDAYGEIPSLRNFPRPDPKPGEIRLKMRAAGVNPMDWRVRDGAPAQFGQTARFPMILGLEGAGVIDALGEGIVGYDEGDAVFGLFWPQVFEYGTFADYLVVPGDARMAKKPAGLSFKQAAVLPLAGGAAMFLHDWLDLKSGETLLIVGATGGVGSYMVQLANLSGVRVLATSTEADAAYIRSLGADETIDFQRELVADDAVRLAPDGLDALIDLVSSPGQLAEIGAVVRSGGRVASLINGADVEALEARGIRAENILSHPIGEHFQRLGQLVEEAKLTIPIEHVFPLEDAAEALTLCEKGQGRGKIVLSISD